MSDKEADFDNKKQRLKKAVRAEMLKKRAALSADYIKKTEEARVPVIMDFLAAVPLRRHGGPLRVMSYMSYKNEFPTHSLNAAIKKAGYTLILPYTDGDFRITACALDSPEQLTVSRMGITEPLPGLCRHFEPFEIDVVLMPGVVFDACGGRIGFGKGCYDRFLTPRENVSRPMLVALAYDFQIVKKVPSETTDVPCGFIITESRIIKT